MGPPVSTGLTALAVLLVVTGNGILSQWARECLVRVGHDIVVAPTAWDGLRTLETIDIHGVLFDTDAGDMSGRRFSGWMRRQLGLQHLPILFLSGPSPEAELGRALANTERASLLRKPLACSDVQREIERLLGSASVAASEDVTPGGLALDPSRFVVSGKRGAVTLTPTEFRLLAYLTERAGVIVGAEELLEKVWGFDRGAGRRDLVRAHMRNLRAKIGSVNGTQEVIRTLPGRGYQLAL